MFVTETATRADLAPTSVSLVLRVSALARRMLPGPFDMPLFVSACGERWAGSEAAQADGVGLPVLLIAVQVAATEVAS